MPFLAPWLCTTLAVSRNCLICSLVRVGSSAATAMSPQVRHTTAARINPRQRRLSAFMEDPPLSGWNSTPLRRNGQPKIPGMAAAKPVAVLLQNRSIRSPVRTITVFLPLLNSSGFHYYFYPGMKSYVRKLGPASPPTPSLPLCAQHIPLFRAHSQVSRLSHPRSVSRAPPCSQ